MNDEENNRLIGICNLIDLVDKKLPAENRGLIDNVWFRVKISDYTKPIVVTFAPMSPFLTKYTHSDIKENNDIEMWGYDYILKIGLNVLSFSPLRDGLWYRERGFEDAMERLGSVLEIFPVRYGYGGSMGGFGVSAYADALHLDHLLLMNPFTSLSRSVVPFETRFENFVKNNTQKWESGYIDGARTNATGYVIYDPVHSLDARHASRFKNMEPLKLPGVGHHMPKHLQALGMLGWITRSFFLEDGYIDKKRFIKEARKRRQYLEYYNGLLNRRYNRHLTACRERVIIYHKYHFLIRELEKVLNEHQLLFLKRIWMKKNIMNITKQAKNSNIFLLKLALFSSKKGRKGIALSIFRLLMRKGHKTHIIKKYINEIKKN
jgi:hypothetical protein